jgi:hypothetical protein
MVVGIALSVAAFFAGGNLSSGVREARSNRWLLAVFGVSWWIISAKKQATRLKRLENSLRIRFFRIDWLSSAVGLRAHVEARSASKNAYSRVVDCIYAHMHCHRCKLEGALWRRSDLGAREAGLWCGESDAISYAKFCSRSHCVVIRVYDEAGNVIETHEEAGEFKAWRVLTGITPRSPSKTMPEPSIRGHDARFVCNKPVGAGLCCKRPKNFL